MVDDIMKLKNLASLTDNSEEKQSAPEETRIEPPFIYNSKGFIVNDNRNAVIFLEYCMPGCIRYNSFTNRIETNGALPWDSDTKIRSWKDTDTSNCLMYANEYGLKNKQQLEDAICIVAERNSYHPIQEYLNALSYKGEGYIRRLAVEYLGCEDTEYTYECMKLLLLAMVQRAFYPGCKYDSVITFVGNQGLGKSTFFRCLARVDLWFTDSVESFSDRKKLGELLQGKWLVELGEMSAFKKSEVESIKSCITTQVDSYREAYSKFRSDFPRTAIFVGTTNNKTFLKDATGNRRFLVLQTDETRRTKDLFHCETREDDFDNALAEAMHIFKERTKDGKLIPLVLPESVIAEAQERQNNANVFEEWSGVILPWLEEQISEGNKNTCALDIWCNCFDKEKGVFSNREATRINQILDSLDSWERSKSVRIKRAYSGKEYFTYRGRGYTYIGTT